MNSTFQNRLIYSLMLITFAVMTYINLLNQGSIGGADSYMHFMFAKWSFTHPHLLFNHWGKPMFTILSAPFAYFGFKVSVTFNILLTLFSGLIVAKSAQKLGLKNFWLGFLFTVFTPIFFLGSFSSLTETIFAFFIILSVYFFIHEKFHLSALVMSFIPFARTEGVIFFPILIFVLAWSKQYKSIPFLAIGFLVFSIAGYPIYNDWLWPITQSPYHYDSLYGNGDWNHFIEESPMLFGWPILVLFLFGISKSILSTVTSFHNHKTIISILLAGISIGYFAAHSTVWALGMGGSAGLTRVMAGIAPIIALMALIGFEFLFQKVLSIKQLQIIIPIMLGVFIIIEGTTKHRFPLVLGVEEVVLEDAITYLNENELNHNYIIYFNPEVAFEMDLDHFTTTNSMDRVNNSKFPDSGIPVGTIIIWDAHFGPNEARLKKQILEESIHFIKLKDFQPKHPFQVYSGQDFEVVLYQKIANKEKPF